MKTIFTQQEILLITATSFYKRELSKNNDTEKQNSSDKDLLEEACWNGLLYDMLPEIFRKTVDGKKLYLWKTTQATSFIDVELGEVPADKDNYFSIDPYCFLNDTFYN